MLSSQEGEFTHCSHPHLPLLDRVSAPVSCRQTRAHPCSLHKPAAVLHRIKHFTKHLYANLSLAQLNMHVTNYWALASRRVGANTRLIDYEVSSVCHKIPLSASHPVPVNLCERHFNIILPPIILCSRVTATLFFIKWLHNLISLWT